MNISNIKYYFHAQNSARPSGRDIAQDMIAQSATQSAAEMLLGEGRAEGSHSMALTIERLRLFKGETIAPEDRLSLEGVTAEYLLAMSDKEYEHALTDESSRVGAQGADKMREAMVMLFPEDKSLRTNENRKPELGLADAKSTLENYVSNLDDAIKTRNQLQKYLQSENARKYLVDRFGEDGANTVQENTRNDIGVFDGLIRSTLTSLNIIYSFSDASIATEKDGMWTLNSTTGKYSGDSGIYSFTINEDGAVVDNDPSFAVSSRFAF